jgi:hypothetical protein
MLSVRLELVKGGAYDFPDPCDGPGKSSIFQAALSRHRV